MSSLALRFWTALAFAVAAAGLGRPDQTQAATTGERERATEVLFSNRLPVPSLRIEVAERDMDVLRGARNTRWETSRPEVTATVREGTNVYPRVALHLKGARGSFRSIDDKPALTLHFNEFVKGQRFHGLEKISLNNSVQDPTFLCEHIGRRLFAAAGIPVPRVTHASVALNGRPLGLFVLVEGWNQQFLRRHFSDTTGNFYEPPFRADLPDTFEVKSGASPTDHRALNALAAAIDETDETRRWERLTQTLDVDRFVTGTALEVMINHWDSYSRGPNNYRLFHDRTRDRMVFFPHGMDQLFALRRPDADSPLAPAMRGKVATAVMTTGEGRQLYFQQVGWLLTNVYNVADLTREVQTLAARVRPLLKEADSLEEFNSGVGRLIERIADRHETVKQQWKAATTPAAFAGLKPFALKDWNYTGRLGGPGFFRRSGARYLQISANGPSSGGTWRTTVLLEPGRYRVEGVAQIVDVSAAESAASFNEISLRSSVARAVERSASGDGSVRLSQVFTLGTRQFVDFICESNASEGRTVFDPDSLTLSRIGGVR